jgi:Histidinol phosphatase and related hydrolases of the PHP family
MLTDGHTHTQFCPHGSGQDAELMIQRAIKLGSRSTVLLNMHLCHRTLKMTMQELKRG